MVSPDAYNRRYTATPKLHSRSPRIRGSGPRQILVSNNEVTTASNNYRSKQQAADDRKQQKTNQQQPTDFTPVPFDDRKNFFGIFLSKKNPV